MDGTSNTAMVGEHIPFPNGTYASITGTGSIPQTIVYVSSANATFPSTDVDGKTPCPVPAVFGPGSLVSRCHEPMGGQPHREEKSTQNHRCHGMSQENQDR